MANKSKKRGIKVKRKEVIVRGIGVSPGVVIGPAFLMVSENVRIVERKIALGEIHSEISRFESALIETRRQITNIQNNLVSKTGLSDACILDAHLMVLDDRTFIEETIGEIRNKRKNAEVAVKEVSDKYSHVLASVEDDYLRERVSDLKDIARRIILNLAGRPDSSIQDLPQKHIIITVDLSPSETASLRKDSIIGFATDIGSPTSHTSLMARALEIPAIVGLHDISERVSTGDEVLLDGNKGILIIHPTVRQLAKYGKLAEKRRSIERELTTLKLESARTKDNHQIVLSANIEGVEELDAVIQYGAEGVGLFRSEYLYLSKDVVLDEDEQSKVYKNVASRLAPAPVIIRTLDLGGDKFIPKAQHHGEANPFLGCRSIRLSLRYPEHFKMQLRAILRANDNGNVKIMYPMISSLEEVFKANKLLDEAKDELRNAKVSFNEDIDVGVMIEIPSAAITADLIAQHVDFFSIGTNDLIQYTIAVDRINERVAYLYEPTHLAVLNLIKRTIDAGHRNGIWVGLCGEMASDPIMTPLLLGMGVDELSVAPTAVPLIKDAVRSMSYERAVKLAEKSLSCKSGSEVLNLSRKLIQEVVPELLELIQEKNSNSDPLG